MKDLKRRLSLLALCAAFSVGASRAAVIGPIAASAFNDSVDWCQLGCPTDPSNAPLVVLGQSASWVSGGGSTGTVGAGTAADPAPGAAPAATAAGRGLNMPGLPFCLFQASHSRTSETENTTQRMVRRMSFMGGSSKSAIG